MSQAKDNVRKFYSEKTPGLCAVMKKSNSAVTPLPQRCSTRKLHPLTNWEPQPAQQCVCVSAVRLMALSARQAGSCLESPQATRYGSQSTFHDFLARPENKYLIKNLTRLIKEDLYVPRVRSRFLPPLPAMASSLPRSVPHRVSHTESFLFSRVALMALPEDPDNSSLHR